MPGPMSGKGRTRLLERILRMRARLAVEDGNLATARAAVGALGANGPNHTE